MNYKYQIIIISSVVIIIPTIAFSFFLYNTRAIPAINLVLGVDKNTNSINEASMKKLHDMILDIDYSKNTDKLIQVFEREREHYILIVTIIAIILTIFSLFMIINRFVEKDEYVKIQEELMSLKNEVNAELNKLKFSNLCLSIKSYCDSLRDMVTLIYLDNTRVTTFEQFKILLANKLTSYIIEIKTLEIDDDDSKIIINKNIRNFIILGSTYAYKKKWMPSHKLDIKSNSIFINSMMLLKTNFDQKFYEDFKLYLKKMNENIDFGNY